MLEDIKISQSANMLDIEKVGEKIGIKKQNLQCYGRYKAKIIGDMDIDSEKKEGNLVLVSATNPTPAGEGKSTTTIGLGDAFHKLGYKTCIALREPSFGPVLGVKGGAAGGGIPESAEPSAAPPGFHLKDR